MNKKFLGIFIIFLLLTFFISWGLHFIIFIKLNFPNNSDLLFSKAINNDFYKDSGFKRIEFPAGNYIFSLYIPNEWVSVNNNDLIFLDILSGSMLHMQVNSTSADLNNLYVCKMYLDFVDKKFKNISLYKNSNLVDNGIRQFSNLSSCYADYTSFIAGYNYYIRQLNFLINDINVFIFIKIKMTNNNEYDESKLNMISNSFSIKKL